jgi:hypothetical protein
MVESVVITGTEFNAPETGPTRPETIPEKFWNSKDGKVDVDGMARSYVELEKNFSTLKSTPTSTETPANPLAIKAKPSEVSGSNTWSDENLGKWTQEFEKSGKISEATYKEIGLPRPIVDQWIRGQQALQVETKNAAFALVGGEDNYRTMSEWAQTNLSRPEQDAYNAAVVSGDEGVRKNAIEGMFARYEKNEGSASGRHIGGSGGGGIIGFASNQEMIAAMSDKRYMGHNADPAYVEMVRKRVEAMK